MGWASATDIFSTIGRAVVEEVNEKYMSKPAATRVLAIVAKELMRQDWDTVDEAAEEFESYPYVIDALADAGYRPYP